MLHKITCANCNILCIKRTKLHKKQHFIHFIWNEKTWVPQNIEWLTDFHFQENVLLFKCNIKILLNKTFALNWSKCCFFAHNFCKGSKTLHSILQKMVKSFENRNPKLSKKGLSPSWIGFKKCLHILKDCCLNCLLKTEQNLLIL